MKTKNILSIGVFDGVHLGHLAIIQKADKVISFYPHPKAKTKLLTTLEEKKELIPNLQIIRFNQKIKQMQKVEFVDLLVKKYHPKKIIVGYDFAFASNRQGRAKDLLKLGTYYGFETEIVPAFKINNKIPKSSKIRKLLTMGKIAEANLLLGRNYSLKGTVIHGKKLGRTIDFPTANLKISKKKLIPQKGVYIGKNCLINVGKLVEVHFLDLNNDLYGKTIKIEFFKKIRDLKKFRNTLELKKQLLLDKKKLLIFQNS